MTKKKRKFNEIYIIYVLMIPSIYFFDTFSVINAKYTQGARARDDTE